ncbi:unnamed protein product [Parnassius mnemosyne]|uniref:Uncharacterized protein n=1 Tax=Parnassius mnemosyne TaxID=213953 RepID=A0AAV1K9L1_9NEOP
MVFRFEVINYYCPRFFKIVDFFIDSCYKRLTDHHSSSLQPFVHFRRGSLLYLLQWYIQCSNSETIGDFETMNNSTLLRHRTGLISMGVLLALSLLYT